MPVHLLLDQLKYLFYLHNLELINSGLNQMESLFLSHTEVPGGSDGSPQDSFRDPDFTLFCWSATLKSVFLIYARGTGSCPLCLIWPTGEGEWDRGIEE